MGDSAVRSMAGSTAGPPAGLAAAGPAAASNAAATIPDVMTIVVNRTRRTFTAPG